MSLKKINRIFNGKFYFCMFSLRSSCRGFFYEINFRFWRVHVGHVKSEFLPEHRVGNDGKGQAKDRDGTPYVGDVSQCFLVAVW